MGQIIILSIGGSLFQNIGSELLSQILPDLPADDIIRLTTGTHSPIFEALSQDLQTRVVEQITLALRNVYFVMVATSGLAFIGSLFLSVSV